MAYQNVGTPRFYIDNILWYKSLGILKANPGEDVFDLNPSNIISVDATGNGYWFDLDFSWGTINMDIGYVALLGHNFSDATICSVRIGTNIQNTIYLNDYDGVTYGTALNFSSPTTDGYDGFSIVEVISTVGTFNNTDALNVHIKKAGISKLGAASIGTIYDMPHSPDLKLTMTREMDGVKRIRTKGGADLVNHKYTKPAPWGNAGAWELYSGTPNHALSRSGRRVWDLSFSYLQDSDVFAPTELQGAIIFDKDGYTEGTDYATGTSYWSGNMRFLAHDDFYTQVIHKTNGGQLPFIFQPDGSNNNPDGFAICKFNMKEFKFEQVANGVYNMKLKIREVW